MKPAVALIALLWAAPLAAQQNPAEKFAIADNSFLVEEAFNQERGIFQNILVVQKVQSDWALNFTQEWPLGGMRHQLSYTLPLQYVKPGPNENYIFSRGAVGLNYRLQVLEESTSQPALSPRVSVLLPQNPADNGYGLQFNVPASKQFGDFYVHANAGATFNGISSVYAQNSFSSAASAIYRLRPMVHLMLESAFATNVYDSDSASSLLMSPGVRAGFNLGEKQLVLGAAVPIGVMKNDAKSSLLGYLSYELPF